MLTVMPRAKPAEPLMSLCGASVIPPAPIPLRTRTHIHAHTACVQTTDTGRYKGPGLFSFSPLVEKHGFHYSSPTHQKKTLHFTICLCVWFISFINSAFLHTYTQTIFFHRRNISNLFGTSTQSHYCARSIGKSVLATFFF